MRIRKPSTLEAAAQIAIAVYLAMLTIDCFHALGASACSAGVRDGCYPWGAEGPAAGLWYYRTKGAYLLWTIGSMLVATAALAAPFVAAGRRSGLVTIAIVLAVGHAGLRYFGGVS